MPIDSETTRSIREPWRPGRLQLRFLVVTSLILVGVSATIAVSFRQLAVDAIEQARFRAASEVAGSLALRFSGSPMQPSDLHQVLSEYLHDNSEIVALAVLVGDDSETGAGMRIDRRVELVEAKRTEGTVSRIVVEKGERLWSVAAPVRHDGEITGAVGVWSSLHASEVVTRATSRLAIVVLPISILILAALLSVVFRREVHRPLAALGAAMMRAESGDGTPEAPVLKNDEIGFIAKRYNEMLATIGETQQEREFLVSKLQDFNSELTLRVKDATVELENRNQQLEQLNQELYRLQQRLVRTERQSLAEHMTARVAHKIGTPLNLISGHVQLLKGLRTDDAKVQEKLGVIEIQIEKLSAIIREFLDEARAASYRMKRLDLHKLVTSMKTLLAPTLAERNIQMVLELDGTEPIVVEADKARLEQVFLTLINNSFDALPDGGRIRIGVEARADSVIVRLEDDGIGIPDAMLHKIFQPFFTTKAPGRGTGLGLSIVTEILSAHRATIHAESALGATTFTIEFPRPTPSAV